MYYFSFVDGHCDTLTKAYDCGESLYKNNIQNDFYRLNLFDSPIQFFAIFLKKYQFENPEKFTKEYIKFLYTEIYKNQDIIKQGFYFEDIIKNQKEHKCTAILSIEGGETIGNNLENIYNYYELGARMFTITWNYENNLGYGAKTGINKGLKPFGKEAIQIMNKLGIIVDVSHLNEAGFWDIYNISDKPFVASHSNAYSICNNIRNLKDEQLKAIRDKNGVIGINFYPYFLNNSEIANIDDILRHIAYIINLIGEDYISFGSDFDGINITPIGIYDITGFNILRKRLEKEYSKEIVEKIFYLNYLRILKDIL